MLGNLPLAKGGYPLFSGKTWQNDAKRRANHLASSVTASHGKSLVGVLAVEIQLSPNSRSFLGSLDAYCVAIYILILYMAPAGNFTWRWKQMKIIYLLIKNRACPRTTSF